MNCLSIDDFRIVKLSQDLGMHPALVSAKVAVWQQENGNTNAFPKAEDLVNVSITSNDKIIWGHPGIGKTFLHEQGKDNIIDFDSVYKSRINKELGLPEGKDGWKFRNEWRKTHEEEWKQKIRQLWKEAKEEAKKTNKILLASDIILLREFSSDFDKVINMSDETFIKRAKQRNDYTEGNTEGWKSNINEVLKNIDKSKVFTTNKYLSDLFKVEDLVGKIINIYHSGKTGVDNKSLSNLAERPFTHNEKRYFSVEHAYQSLKSGKFDLTTYNAYKSGGIKISGLKAKTEGNYNIILMKQLIKESFEQNPSAKEELLNTGNSQLTHTQDNTLWKTKFPELLMEVRNELNGQSKITTQLTADKLIQSRIVNEYFNAKEISDIFQNIQTLQQLIKGFKGTFAESEAFINALNKLGYDINKDYTGIVAHTTPDKQFYKNWKNVTSKVDGIDRILNDKFLKQSIITAIDLMKVSKLFFISQTSLAKNIQDTISSLFKSHKAAKTDFKNNFRKNFLSYLTATAYRHSVRNNDDLKLPHIKDFLLTPLAEITPEDNKEYNDLQSKFLQIVFHNKENGINNEFLNFLQIENIDYNNHKDSMLYGYRLHQFIANSRSLKDPDKIQALISGFNELYFANNNNIMENDPEIKRINNLKHEFAKEMFNYLLVKDGLMYQNQSFIKAIDPILFLETSYKLDDIQQLFKKDNVSSNEFLKIFGLTKEELELDFTLKFGLHASNYFDLKSQRLDVILTDKKDRDVKIAKDAEEQKKDKDSENTFENAGEGFEEENEEELVKEDNYPLYFNNEDNSLTVNQFAGETFNMKDDLRKERRDKNKRYILAKENEIFKTILEPFETQDKKIKHYPVIGLPIITYVNKKIGNNITKRIPLKLAVVQNTIKVNGNVYLTLQFTPEGKLKYVNESNKKKFDNLGVMFTDLQENSIFDIINNSKSLKLKTSQANVKYLVEIAQELSKFYRGGYIIGTKAKFIDYMTFGSAKLSSFGDDIESQEKIKLSEEDLKTSMAMYNRKDRTIKEEDKRKILLDNFNKLESTSDFSYKMKDFEGMLTSDMEKHYKNRLKVMDNNLTEQEIENKIKECYAKIKK